MLTISQNGVALVCTLLVPVLVAVVTKSGADKRLKAVVTMVATALITLITSAVEDNGAAIISTQMMFDWAVTTAISVVSYLGLWKPLGNDTFNERILPTKGIG